MSKQKCGYMIAMLPEIEKMIDSGMTHRQIEDELGLKGDRPIHNLLKRQRRKVAEELPKFRGRKPAKTLQEYKYENKRLKMEVECCGIFCSPQKGSETQSKVCSYPSSPEGVSNISNV